MKNLPFYFAAVPLAILLSGCQPSSNKTTPQGLGVADKIAFVYHGIPLDAERKPISLDRASVADSIDRILASYRQVSPSKDLELVGQLIKKAEPQKGKDAYDGLSLKGLQAELLLESQPGTKTAELVSKLAFMREWLKASLELQVSKDENASKAAFQQFAALDKIQLPPTLLERLRNWWPERFVVVVGPSIKIKYAISCSIRGVPAPPKWGTAGWTRRSVGGVNTVPDAKLFLSSGFGSTTEVWTSTGPNGGCIALPRKDAGGATGLLGVICQNSNNGRACFYDNRPHAGGATFSFADMATTKNNIADDWVNGGDPALSGGGKCTACHRGENAFLLHNDTILSNNPALAFNTNSASWYQMINSLGWTNPPATTFGTAGGCTSCHAIGSTTDAEKSSYCGILKKAANQEMPSTSSPATWNPAAGSPYKAHIDALKANGC